MKISEMTGLPELPEGFYFNVSHQPTYGGEDYYAMKIMSKREVEEVEVVPTAHGFWQELIAMLSFRPAFREEFKTVTKYTTHRKEKIREMGSKKAATHLTDEVVYEAAVRAHAAWQEDMAAREAHFRFIGDYPPNTIRAVDNPVEDEVI